MNLLLVCIALPLLFIALIYIAYFKRSKPKDLRGKNVLITGGGSGIGKSMAHLFAKEGCNLILWDIREEFLESASKELKEGNTGVQVHTYVCDVSNRSLVYSVAEKVKSDVGKIDILVNNAGIVIGKLLLELRDEEIQRTMEVNSLAHFWTLKAFLPAMIESNDGHIVTVASVMGYCGAVGLSDYCCSKFAAVGLHESLRLELYKMKKYGVKTTLLCPFGINTGMFDGLSTSLIPLLDESFVSRQAVDAVKHEQYQVTLPRYLRVLYVFMQILPSEWKDVVIRACGGLSGMDNFKGRGVAFSMKKI